jgi:two-component system nitrogen regulation response regulator GlnG/two-component system response regulator HydG
LAENHSETQTGNSTWQHASQVEESESLHLTLLWSRHEPERVGEVCALPARALFGRGAESDPRDPPKLELLRQRPRSNEPTGFLENSKVSRRQWLIETRANGVAVKNVGRRALLHNGVTVDQCQAEEGDTLGVDGVLLCLVERRPRVLGAVQYDAFSFGEVDADGIVGESPAAWHFRRDIAALARVDAHALVLGESGSGKELAARAIHRRSQRAQGPLVSRNAATIPETLVEVELFGNVANYPNAGTPARRGLAGAAHGGTLFLDEIAELAEAQQANLLRVLDSGEYQRLGEDAARRSDFRLIGATNRPPEDLKHDLLARCPEHLLVPDLRSRRSDVPLLVRFLIERLGARDRLLKPDLLDHLVRHRYTHHFRELERLVRLAQRTSPDGSLDLTREVLAEIDIPTAAGVPTEAEVREALKGTKSSAEAAKRLGVASRFALYRLMKKYGIES